MTTVRIKELGINGREWRSRARATDKHIAAQAAVKKHFGPKAYFFQDAGLSHGLYGQVMVHIGGKKQDASTSKTGRVRIDVASH